MMMLIFSHYELISLKYLITRGHNAWLLLRGHCGIPVYVSTVQVRVFQATPSSHELRVC